jgi:hypothetical protein
LLCSPAPNCSIQTVVLMVDSNLIDLDMHLIRVSARMSWLLLALARCGSAVKRTRDTIKEGRILHGG